MSKKSNLQAQDKKFAISDNPGLLSLNSITASSVAEFSLLPSSSSRPITCKQTSKPSASAQDTATLPPPPPHYHSQTSSSTLAYSSSQNDTIYLSCMLGQTLSARPPQRTVAIQTETSFILAHHENSTDDIDCDLLTDNSGSDSARTATTNNSDYDSEMEKITWALGYDHYLEMESDFYRSSRPSGPDAEMMTVGKRFNDPNALPTKTCANILLLDGVVDLESDGGAKEDHDHLSYTTPALQKFSILPPSGLIKPVATRRVPPAILEYYPISPPSSERTLPSETGSDVSSGIHSSIISSPDFARAASICSGGSSAFTATHVMSLLADGKGHAAALSCQFQLKPSVPLVFTK